MATLTLAKNDTAATVSAVWWLIDMEQGQERRRLYNEHRIRRVDIMRNGYRATDHTAADAWLIEEYRKAHDMSKRYTENYNTVELQGYTDAQIAFIASVEHDYRHRPLSELTADYAEELDSLAGKETT